MPVAAESPAIREIDPAHRARADRRTEARITAVLGNVDAIRTRAKNVYVSVSDGIVTQDPTDGEAQIPQVTERAPPWPTRAMAPMGPRTWCRLPSDNAATLGFFSESRRSLSGTSFVEPSAVWKIGKGSPQYRCRLKSQSRSL